MLTDLAGAQETRGEFDKAIDIYERLYERNPDNAIAANNLAALTADHRSDQESLNRALEMVARFEDTEVPIFLDTVAWLYYRLGQHEKAVEILQKVVRRAPTVPVFRYHLGMAYRAQQRNQEAIAELEKAVAKNASYTGIDHAREALRQLKSS